MKLYIWCKNSVSLKRIEYEIGQMYFQTRSLLIIVRIHYKRIHILKDYVFL